METTSILSVLYLQEAKLLPLGRLAKAPRLPHIYFEYDRAFLDTGLQLSPFKLPLKPGVMRCDESLFEGLFGLFADSLPDGWGRLLIDRMLIQKGIDPHLLTPLDRLRIIGDSGMGALRYHPAEHLTEKTHTHVDLDIISQECTALLQLDDEDGHYLDELLSLNGASGGARPKILLELKDSKEAWLIKFASLTDSKDIGAIEYAYHLMAEKAGLNVPKAKLFNSKRCPGYFGVQRFDRTTHGSVHVHSASGLLHADFRYPSLSYETLLKATSWLTKSSIETENMFKYAAFNILAHNRDDHARNFSFLMHPNGKWEVAPAYDLIFSSGPGGEHSTAIMGEGRNPGPKDLLRLAEATGLVKKEKAQEIILAVEEAVSHWPEIAVNAGVSKKSIDSISRQLKQNHTNRKQAI